MINTGSSNSKSVSLLLYLLKSWETCRNTSFLSRNLDQRVEKLWNLVLLVLYKHETEIFL